MVVVPTGKRFPVGTPARVTVTEQLSLATGLPSVASFTTLPQIMAPAPVATLTAAGAVRSGGVLSTTVTIWVPVTEFPLGSVAV